MKRRDLLAVPILALAMSAGTAFAQENVDNDDLNLTVRLEDASTRLLQLATYSCRSMRERVPLRPRRSKGAAFNRPTSLGRIVSKRCRSTRTTCRAGGRPLQFGVKRSSVATAASANIFVSQSTTASTETS